jgi:hypothetical protein
MTLGALMIQSPFLTSELDMKNCYEKDEKMERMKKREADKKKSAKKGKY